MNIIINTHLLVKNKLDGIGWFTYETVRRIIANHPEHNFILLFDQKPSDEFIFGSNSKCIVVPPPARHPLLWYIRFEILLPRVIKKHKGDVFVTPDGWMTLGTSIPCVQVIHDINFVHYPKGIPFLAERYYNIMFPKYARRASRIVTVSHFSKQDIARNFGISQEKIDVAYNGCNTIFEPKNEIQNKATKDKTTGGNPYFLFVGALIPRKNIARLFSAFEMFKSQDTNNTKLVIVGARKWWTQEIENSFQSMQHRDDIIFLGRLDASELNNLYSASLALTFVPIFEGFGIPILEAFNSGTAVITSNVTSMPEVAGDAAILADPFSVESIAEAMCLISNQPDLRDSLIKKGREWARNFSWDKTAAVLWDNIEKAHSANKKGEQHHL